MLGEEDTRERGAGVWSQLPFKQEDAGDAGTSVPRHGGVGWGIGTPGGSCLRLEGSD